MSLRQLRLDLRLLNFDLNNKIYVLLFQLLILLVFLELASLLEVYLDHLYLLVTRMINLDLFKLFGNLVFDFSEVA